MTMPSQEDITEMTPDRIALTRELYRLITLMQRNFMRSRGASQEWWAETLEGFLRLTSSEYGFIGTVESDHEGPFLRTRAITDISWDEATRKLYEENQTSGMVFRNLDTLFGRVMAERQTIVSNHVADDPRAGGRPPGHPDLNTFLGLACGNGPELTAMIGLANRPDGYSDTLIEDLHPATLFVRAIVETDQNVQLRRRAEAKLNSLLDNSVDAIIVIDLNDTMVEVNTAVETIFGYTPEECIGNDVSMLMTPTDRHQHDEYIARFMRTGEKRVIGKPREVAGRRKDGSTVWLDLYVSENNRDGNSGFIGVLRDVTSRVESERALRHTAAQLSSALEMAKAGHWEYSVAEDMFTFNDAFYKIFGTTAEALGGYTLTSAEYAGRFVHPDETEVVREEIGRALNYDEEPYVRELQHRFIYADGRVGHLAVRLTSSLGSDGTVERLNGVIQDITEQFAQEQSRIRIIEQERMNEQLAMRVAELDRHRSISALTSQCVELLQRCISIEEGIEVVTRFVGEMYPSGNVQVYVKDEAMDHLHLHHSFDRLPGEEAPALIEMHDCWATRTRRMYVTSPSGTHLVCAHLPNDRSQTTLCAPLVSMDQMVAVICVQMPFTSGVESGEVLRSDRLAAQFETTIQSLGGALSTISLRESLQRIALVDELTQLPNRRAFNVAARRTLSRIARSRDDAALGILDLDHFKKVNDAWGHDGGDQVLQTVGRVATRFFRGEDLAGRFGGEEFVLLLAGVDEATARTRLESFRLEVENTCRLPDQTSATISVGFTMVGGRSATELDVIVREADNALYAAKASGRNCVRSHRDTLTPDAGA